ncbi:MAG: hypothetical protein WBC07_08015 [Methylotenera sp.]
MLYELHSLSESKLQKLFTLLGALIACQTIYIQHGWINDDSVLYFEVARLFSAGEWKQGFALYNWSFYSVILSLVNQLTSLSIQTSAQILNIIFFAITTFSFIHLIRLSGGGKSTIIYGAVLLLSSGYIVGDILPMLLRDQGFWAAFLTALIFYIQFYRSKKLREALLWQVCMIIAMLFRVEAITFLIGMPIALFLNREISTRQNFKYFFIINSISIAAFIGILSLLFFVPSIHLSDFGRLQEAVIIFPRMMSEIAHSFQLKAGIMNEQILGSLLNEYGMIGIILTLIGIIFLKTIGLISWPVAGICALRFTVKRACTPTKIRQDSYNILLWALALALVNACFILASVFVLSGRYIISLGFILLILIAFYISPLIDSQLAHSLSKQKKLILLALVISISLSGIGNLIPKGEGYNYEQEAVAYLKQQQVADSKVFYVSARVRYHANAPYAGRDNDYWKLTKDAINDGSINSYDYLLLNLRVDKSNPKQEKALTDQLTQFKVIKEFYGYKKKKKVMIFAKEKSS